MSWSEEEYKQFQRERGATAFRDAQAVTPKPSKYRNVKVVIDGEKFDSKREAQHWQMLKLREKAGEIRDLRRQVAFHLMCPSQSETGLIEVVASYLADFVFTTCADGISHIEDVKGGKETAMFALKRKWLFLQSGIEIEVIR